MYSVYIEIPLAMYFYLLDLQRILSTERSPSDILNALTRGTKEIKNAINVHTTSNPFFLSEYE